MMKASVIRGFGGTEVFDYCDLDTPRPGPDDVLIKIGACGINHYDIFFRRGLVNRDVELPHVLGADVVGEVAEVGQHVQRFGLGDRVLVAPGFPLDPADYEREPINLARSYSVTGGVSWGGYAQYMVAPARFVLSDPPDLEFEQLATIPLVLVTAVHATRTLGRVAAGQKVLVQAGASGSGAMCLQVAKALGAEVAATIGSAHKAEFVESLGADLIINYKEEDFVEKIKAWTAGRGVDAVIDNVGGGVFEGNIKALKRGGHFVNFGMVGGPKAEYVFALVFYKQIHLHGSMMGTTEELQWGLDLVRQGIVKPILDRAVPLADVAGAHEYVESRQVKGKVVLLPWE